MLVKTLLLAVFFSLTTTFVECTPPNLHTRSAHDHHQHNKERIDDAFDAHLTQYANAEADDHELDHEAILGKVYRELSF